MIGWPVNAMAAAALPEETYQLTTVATKLRSPWSMVQLPDSTWLITERDGHITIVNGKTQTRVQLELEGLYVAGQGGLLDIVLVPQPKELAQAAQQLIFTYAKGTLQANNLAIAQAMFNGETFTKPRIIYEVSTKKDTPQHYAGRTLILPDNTLLFSSGDGFDYREQAQVLSSQLGKILRINIDGSLPPDNPFIHHNSPAAHAIFSLGHRNPQGLIYDSDHEKIISHEHGPAGGDELNYLSAGTNYGWPVITYGKDYSGARISPFTEYPGMQQPDINWTPSIAPSGMAYYSTQHQAFLSLQHHGLVTTLVDRKLYAVNLESGKFEQTAIFPEISGRLRDVLVTQTGDIAVLTDGKNAKLILLRAE